MKPQVTDAKMRPSATKLFGSEAVLVLQDELVAAIHGAFEVAVEIAVREVKTLVGQATRDIYEELRRENESLKQRLQKAEAMLDSECMDERSVSPPPPATNQIFNATEHTDELPYLTYNQTSPNHEVGGVHSCTEVRGDEPPAGHCRVIHPEDGYTSRNEEQRSSSDAASEPEKEQNIGCTKEVTEEISHTCLVKVEGLNPLCQDSGDKDREPCQLPNTDANSTLARVTVKQEKAEEESDASSCYPESIKVEDFSLESVSAAQFKMWKTEEADIQSQDPSTQLSNAGMDQVVHPPNLTMSLQRPADLPSVSSEFPNIFQLTEPAPLSEAPPQVYGVHVRTSRNVSHALATLYTCKCCGETFHLPSLLRRHYGQCQQRLQQRCHQPVAGSKRTRLQLYPPGCSPFRCTECNREFNRMENLKTHLRIHTGERPYTCSVCSKCFRHSGALTRHFRIHTGEKPYVCGQCGRSFRNCGGLRFHQRSHSKQTQ